MADCQITCIIKPHPQNSHEHITHVGNCHASPPWRWPRENVIASIDRGDNTFYVIDPYNGKRANVRVVRPTGRPAYLQTVQDGDWSNNLLSLEQCQC